MHYVQIFSCIIVYSTGTFIWSLHYIYLCITIYIESEDTEFVHLLIFELNITVCFIAYMFLFQLDWKKVIV